MHGVSPSSAQHMFCGSNSEGGRVAAPNREDDGHSQDALPEACRLIDEMDVGQAGMHVLIGILEMG